MSSVANENNSLYAGKYVGDEMAKGHLNVGHKQLRLRATNSSSQHDAVTAQTRPNDAPARERVTTRLGLKQKSVAFRLSSHIPGPLTKKDGSSHPQVVYISYSYLFNYRFCSNSIASSADPHEA